MPDPSQITVTSKTGPGLTVTSQLIRPMRELHFEVAPFNIAYVIDSSGKRYDFDINATTTITITASAGVLTAVISQ